MGTLTVYILSVTAFILQWWGWVVEIEKVAFRDESIYYLVLYQKKKKKNLQVLGKKLVTGNQRRGAGCLRQFGAIEQSPVYVKVGYLSLFWKDSCGMWAGIKGFSGDLFLGHANGSTINSYLLPHVKSYVGSLWVQRWVGSDGWVERKGNEKV